MFETVLENTSENMPKVMRKLSGHDQTMPVKRLELMISATAGLAGWLAGWLAGDWLAGWLATGCLAVLLAVSEGPVPEILFIGRFCLGKLGVEFCVGDHLS